MNMDDALCLGAVFLLKVKAADVTVCAILFYAVTTRIWVSFVGIDGDPFHRPLFVHLLFIYLIWINAFRAPYLCRIPKLAQPPFPAFDSYRISISRYTA